MMEGSAKLRRNCDSNQIAFVQHDAQFAEADADDFLEVRDRVNNRHDDIAGFYSAGSLNRTADFGDVALRDRVAIHYEHSDRTGVGA